MDATQQDITPGSARRKPATPRVAAGRKRRRPVSRQTRQLRSAPGPGEPCGLAPAGARPGGRIADVLMRPTYRLMVHELRRQYKITVRRWRSDMAGVAYELTYKDGRIKRLIAAPRPRSEVSACIFLHEVGHHAIGFRRYQQRCLEEHYVWQWTFREMAARGIAITPRVLRHYRRSMHHYVRRAQRRGEHVPGELAHFAQWPG